MLFSSIEGLNLFLNWKVLLGCFFNFNKSLFGLRRSKINWYGLLQSFFWYDMPILNWRTSHLHWMFIDLILLVHNLIGLRSYHRYSLSILAWYIIDVSISIRGRFDSPLIMFYWLVSKTPLIRHLDLRHRLLRFFLGGILLHISVHVWGITTLDEHWAYAYFFIRILVLNSRFKL